MPDDKKPQLPKTMTKEMIEDLKKQLDDMEGKELNEGGPVELKPGIDEMAWYIVYKTTA